MQESAYPKVIYPICKQLKETTSKEAKAFLNWYVSIFALRLEILMHDVKSIEHDWIPDFSEKSLLGLGNWIKSKAFYRTVTLEERKSIIEREKLTGLSAQLTLGMTETLTDETKYRCFDLAVYFGETLRYNVKDTEWIIEERKNVDFHSPILAKVKNIPKGYSPLNPQPIAKTMVNGILKGSSVQSVLSIYKKWFEIFTIGYQEPK